MDQLVAIEIAVAVLNNALAQRAAGAERFEVHSYDDGVEVRDDGPGLPVHPHPRSRRPLIEVILTGPRRGPLNTLAHVTRSCLWLEAKVYRPEGVFRQRCDFAAPGALQGPDPRDAGDPERGTVIRCAPGQGDLPELSELAARLEALVPQGCEVRLVDHRVKREQRLAGGPRA